jgi:hypothetical protein
MTELVHLSCLSWKWMSSGLCFMASAIASALSRASVQSADSYPVSQSKAKRSRQVEFVIDGNTIIGIEQNPNTESRWAAMARLGKPVMQFSVLPSSQSFYEPNNQTDNHQGPYQSVSQHLQPPQT